MDGSPLSAMRKSPNRSQLMIVSDHNQLSIFLLRFPFSLLRFPFFSSWLLRSQFKLSIFCFICFFSVWQCFLFSFHRDASICCPRSLCNVSPGNAHQVKNKISSLWHNVQCPPSSSLVLQYFDLKSEIKLFLIQTQDSFTVITLYTAECEWNIKYKKSYTNRWYGGSWEEELHDLSRDGFADNFQNAPLVRPLSHVTCQEWPDQRFVISREFQKHKMHEFLDLYLHLQNSMFVTYLPLQFVNVPLNKLSMVFSLTKKPFIYDILKYLKLTQQRLLI